MSTADDIATIQAVTDKIAGPMKVWVLEIDAGSVNHIHVHYTFEGVKRMLQHDLESGFSSPPTQAEIGMLVEEFERLQGLTFRDTVYTILHTEVLE